MNMRAYLIENDTIVQKSAPGRSAEDLGEGWIDGPGDWVCGYVRNGETFTSPPPPPAYATAAVARLAMVKWIDGLTAQVMDQYPRAVQARWSIEEAAARAVKADTATADQLALVTDEGAAKSRTPEEHADRIIANADRFRAIADQINKLFLATDAALEAATDPAQYETILDNAIAQAGPLATAYGLNT